MGEIHECPGSASGSTVRCSSPAGGAWKGGLRPRRDSNVARSRGALASGFITLAACPAPSAPMCVTLLPRRSRMGAALAMFSIVPPAMIVRPTSRSALGLHLFFASRHGSHKFSGTHRTRTEWFATSSFRECHRSDGLNLPNSWLAPVANTLRKCSLQT